MSRILTFIIMVFSVYFGPTVGQFYVSAATLAPEELLDDPALEQRARNLAQNLRCVVCANQSIADSEATLALDMQRFIRRELATGATDQAIVDNLIQRYGERVLLSPPVTTRTYLLWGLPALLSVAVIALLWYRQRHHRRTPLAPLPIDDWREEERG